MICALIGAVASIKDEEKGIGKEFIDGLHSIGHVFIPIAGVMASIPYITYMIKFIFGGIFNSFGADPAMAATTFIAVDLGGYQLAHILAGNNENWIMASINGYMAGATIIFSIPIGFALLEKKDHKYMALGITSGILSIPVGVFITTIILAVSNTYIRDTISTEAAADYQLLFNINTILINLAPLIIICVIIALGLKFFPDIMVQGFIIFGRVIDAVIKLVLVFSIIEYFTNIFSNTFGYWGFDSIIADSGDRFRALEISGYIGIMLAGSYPMVYLINKYLYRPLNYIGKRIGLSSTGSAGIIASTAHIIILYRLIKDMPAKDKVICTSFSVCAAYVLGGQLAYVINFQPTITVPLIIGKLAGGAFAVLLSLVLSVPKALEFEEKEKNSNMI
jgi:ethanolamine transporter